jgi:hypothetical protein
MKIFICFLLVINFAFASKVYIYRFGTMSVGFVNEEGFLVSKGCKQKKCQALLKALQFKDSQLPAELLQGGKNPSSVKCKELMGGKVLIGLDEKGNEQSACRFDDDSFLI